MTAYHIVCRRGNTFEIARPPLAIRYRLKDIADVVWKQAREVFAHRGSYGLKQPRQPITRAWRSVYKDGRVSYRIDRSHPLVKDILRIDPKYRSLLEALLRILEKTVPVQQIWLDTSERPADHSRPFETDSKQDAYKVMQMTYHPFAVRSQLSGCPSKVGHKLDICSGNQLDFKCMHAGSGSPVVLQTQGEETAKLVRPYQLHPIPSLDKGGGDNKKRGFAPLKLLKNLPPRVGEKPNFCGGVVYSCL